MIKLLTKQQMKQHFCLHLDTKKVQKVPLAGVDWHMQNTDT